jgi:hypothetical protein
MKGRRREFGSLSRTKAGESMTTRLKRIAMSFGWLAALMLAAGAGWRY